MLSRPDDLDDRILAATLTLHWGVAVARLEYLPVGFGSHHWSVAGPGGGRWFVTVDDLDAARASAAESRDDAFRRLCRALGAARALRDTGAAFVVAPLPTAGGAPVVRLTARYAVAVYPHGPAGPARRAGAGAAAALRRAGRPGGPAAGGPHPRRAAPGQHDAHRGRVAADRLGHRAGGAAGTGPVAAGRRGGRGVREGGRGDVAAGGARLYRTRWDIADLAAGVDRFRAPHAGTADDDETWAIVERIVTGLPAR